VLANEISRVFFIRIRLEECDMLVRFPKLGIVYSCAWIILLLMMSVLIYVHRITKSRL